MRHLNEYRKLVDELRKSGCYTNLFYFPVLLARLLVLLTLPFLACQSFAASCVVCKQTIVGRYLKSNGRPFCGKRCLQTTLPTCAVCQAPVEGQFLRSDGKTYCRRKCLNTTLPTCSLCQVPLQHTFTLKGKVFCKRHASGNRCFSCDLPYTHGRTLPDGRHQCATCAKHGIHTQEEADALLRLAWNKLKQITRSPSETIPQLTLTDRPTLAQLTGRGHGHLDPIKTRGFYSRRAQTISRERNGRVTVEETNVTENIYILDGLTRKAFLITAVHELTHDLLTEHYHQFGKLPLWAEEGFCQYTAAMVCKAEGWDLEFQAIATNPAPVYGDGFRRVYKKFGDDNWKEIDAWLRAGNATRLRDEH